MIQELEELRNPKDGDDDDSTLMGAELDELKKMATAKSNLQPQSDYP